MRLVMQRICTNGSWVEYPGGAKFTNWFPKLEHWHNLDELGKQIEHITKEEIMESMKLSNLDACFPLVTKFIIDPNEHFNRYDFVCLLIIA